MKLRVARKVVRYVGVPHRRRDKFFFFHRMGTFRKALRRCARTGPVGFHVRDGSVSEILRKRRLWAILREARKQIARIFGPAELALETFWDPEAASPAPHLFLVIRPSQGATEANRLLDRLDNEWWLDAKVDRMTITIEHAG